MSGRSLGYHARYNRDSRESWLEEMAEMRRQYGPGDAYEQRATAAFLKSLGSEKTVAVERLMRAQLMFTASSV